MTILELMKRVDSIPALAGAIQRIQVAHTRMKEISAQAAKESAEQLRIVETNLAEISEFFGSNFKVEVPKFTSDTILPEGIDRHRLPTPLPKKKYEKVVALLRAAPEGLTFDELLSAWKSLELEGWHVENLPVHIREAIKTARLKNINVNSGGRGGKFTVK